MNISKVIFATVVIFLAGALTGGLVVRYVSRTQSSLAAKPVEPARVISLQSTNGGRDWRLPAPMMGPLRKDFLDKLQCDLKISAVQRESIEKIICEGQEKTKVIWEEVAPEMRETILQTKDRIRGELNPEQCTQFEALFRPKPRTPPKATNGTPAAVSPATN